MKLHPVVVWIGVLLADADRVSADELGPERGLLDRVAAAIDDLVRQRGRFDPTLHAAGALRSATGATSTADHGDREGRKPAAPTKSGHAPDGTPPPVTAPDLTGRLPGTVAVFRVTYEAFVGDEE